MAMLGATGTMGGSVSSKSDALHFITANSFETQDSYGNFTYDQSGNIENLIPTYYTIGEGACSVTYDEDTGLDTGAFSGNRSNFTVTKSDGNYIVKDANVTETLTNVERLSFDDGTLALDTSGNSGQMYRLYKAAFDRVPDTPGLGHNIRLVDAGLTLAQMSSAFVVSAEFTTTYGALSNAQFINQLYLNVLDRAPDAPGLAHNLNLLNTTLTRADMLAAYSESAENQVAVIGQIQDGIWFT